MNLPTHTDEWLEQRFDIFEKYCFPSLKAQTTTNFIWICLFDIDTPAAYVARIKEYRKDFPNFLPVFYTADEATNLVESLNKTIQEILKQENSSVDYIFTTNIDNDDAFAIDAIEVLQTSLKPTNSKTLYSLVYGYQYFTKNGFVLKMRYRNNHFLSLLEVNRDSLETIRFYSHGRAIRQLEGEYIHTKKGMWLEFVHPTNVSNDFRINSKIRNIPVVCKNDFFHNFGLDLKMSWWKQILKNIYVLPVEFIVTGVNRLRTKSQRAPYLK